MAKKLEGMEINIFTDGWNHKKNSKVIDIYRRSLIKHLEKVFEREEPDIIRYAELNFLSTGMLERVMIDYGLGDKIEGRYITYDKKDETKTI